MWYLTNNKVEFEGHIFTQVKRELPNGKWEYGGYVEELPKIRGEFWIGKDSYMFKDCVVEGNIRIHENCVIKNSALFGTFSIKNNCNVVNSCVDGRYTNVTAFDTGCTIINQNFKSVGRYPVYFFEDDIIESDTYNGNILSMTNNYCKVNCLIMTYETAWSYLNDDEKWEFIKSRYPDTPKVYLSDTKKWLQYWCEKQLKRKQGRAK